MRLTIVPGDKTVIVDGERREVDCSALHSCDGIHAVQWDGLAGHEEWVQSGLPYKSNTPLSSVDKYADVVAAWNAAPPPPTSPSMQLT